MNFDYFMPGFSSYNSEIKAIHGFVASISRTSRGDMSQPVVRNDADNEENIVVKNMAIVDSILGK